MRLIGATMTDVPASRRKPLRCRIGLHTYVKKIPDSTAEPYLECTGCGKEQFPGDTVIVGLGS